MCYEMGYGCIQSDDQAAEYYHKAADAHYAPGQYNYSRCLLEGRGVAKDIVVGREYLQLAADGGLAIAKRDIMYDLSKDRIRELCDEGFPCAQVYMGYLKFDDFLVTKKAEYLHEAIHLFCKAAEQPDPSALTALGVICATAEVKDVIRNEDHTLRRILDQNKKWFFIYQRK